MDGSLVNHFSPDEYLANGKVTNSDAATRSADLLILNQPIRHFDVLARLWMHTKYKVCADGGANRLFDLFEGALVSQRDQYLPSIIHGDLDSLRDDVRTYYAARGVEVLQDPDQYSTDVGKTMNKISKEMAPDCQKDVLILGTLAGRVDQGIGLLGEMLRESEKHPQLRLWLFSETNLSFILPKGHNVMDRLQSCGFFTENVGLLPVWGPATITTRGLEWDVEDWHTHMGGQVSTSNHVKADEVHVHTDAPILFTIEQAPPRNPRCI